MATTYSQALPASTAAISSATTSTTSQRVVGSHVFRIDGFSTTKNLGIGKCIKSSTFRVGGHVWYIECYPCGVHEGRAGWVTLFLCRQDDDHGSNSVSGCYQFNLMESLKDGYWNRLDEHPGRVFDFADDEDRHPRWGCSFIKREELGSLLKDDCFHVRCLVFIDKFPAAPPPDHATKAVAWSHSHVLTVCKTRRAFLIGESIESSTFHVGGHCWCFQFYPRGEDENKDDGRVTVELFIDEPGYDDEVTVQLQVTLLTHAGQIISSTQDFSTFSERNDTYVCNFLIMMEHESSPLLQDGVQIRCDIAVVNGITATPNLRRGISGDLKGSQYVRGDVTFDVGGHLFAAHKCVLATRFTAFMAEFFGPSRQENADVTDHVHVDGMEPRVFEALLHFIYTDALELHEDDKVVMAQGLLVAADQYAMERLKLICSDLLCSYINDARTAVTTHYA